MHSSALNLSPAFIAALHAYVDAIYSINSDFVFFETAHRPTPEDGGWFFIPLQRVDKVAGPFVKDLVFTLNNSSTTTGAEGTKFAPGISGYPAAMLRSINFDFVTTGDKWATVVDGSWCGMDIRHNPYKKSFDVYKSDYLKHLHFDKYSHASKTPVYWPPDPSWRKISEWPEANISFSSSSGSKSMSNINANTRRANYPWSKTPSESFLQRRLQVNHMLNYERVQCEMYGISGLQIGKLATAEFPQIGLGSGTPAETGLLGSRNLLKTKDRNDNTWMITKLGHHIIFNDDIPYKTTMELANTMKTTEFVLPEYGSLTGAHPGQSTAGR